MPTETPRGSLKNTNFYRLLNKIENFGWVIIWDPFGVKEWIEGVGDKRCRRREGNIFTRSHLRGRNLYLLPCFMKPTPESLNRINTKWQKLHILWFNFWHGAGAQYLVETYFPSFSTLATYFEARRHMHSWSNFVAPDHNLACLTFPTTHLIQFIQHFAPSWNCVPTLKKPPRWFGLLGWNADSLARWQVLLPRMRAVKKRFVEWRPCRRMLTAT